jgi:hypothetical protein
MIQDLLLFHNICNFSRRIHLQGKSFALKKAWTATPTQEGFLVRLRHDEGEIPECGHIHTFNLIKNNFVNKHNN